MDNFDIELEKIFKNDIHISNAVDQRINKTLKNLPKQNNKFDFIKKISTFAACLVLLSGFVFAEEISEKIYDIYNFRKREKIETKLPEEVINNQDKLEKVLNNKNAIIPWDDSAAEVIENNDLKFDITNIYMNDYYLDFDISVNFPDKVLEKININDINNVRLPDLVIRDENDNIIFCMEENKLKEIFGTEDLEAIKNNSKYCISEVGHYSSDYNSFGVNPYIVRYNLNTRLPSIYPKSKKLIFEFTKVALDKVEASIGIDDKSYLHQDQSLTVRGNWKIEVDVPQICSEREDVIAYKLVENNPNPKNELLFCYYKDDVMRAKIFLASEERSGPWGNVKLGDMLTEYGVKPIIADYIVYNISNTDEYKRLDNWWESVRNIEEYYIENSKGQKSKEEGLLKKVRR